MGDKTKGKAKQVEGELKKKEGEAQEMWGDAQDEGRRRKGTRRRRVGRREGRGRGARRSRQGSRALADHFAGLGSGFNGHREPGTPGSLSLSSGAFSALSLCGSRSASARLSHTGVIDPMARMSSSRRTAPSWGATMSRRVPRLAASRASRKSVRTPALSTKPTSERSSTTTVASRPTASTFSSQRATVERSSSPFTSTTEGDFCMVTEVGFPGAAVSQTAFRRVPTSG